MRGKSLSLAVVMAAAACGAALNATYQATSPTPLESTLRCVMAATDSLGYKSRLVNGNKGVEAQHKDSTLQQFEDGRYDKISASGANSKSNEGSSSLVISAATFSQQWTRVGLETDEIPASDKVKKDAQTVVARCGGGQS
jgi:hypothetical protein